MKSICTVYVTIFEPPPPAGTQEVYIRSPTVSVLSKRNKEPRYGTVSLDPAPAREQ